MTGKPGANVRVAGTPLGSGMWRPELDAAEDCSRIESLPRRASDLDLWTVHLMGSARISQHPRDGVTDSAGRVHGVPGLCIADASLFPTAIGVNPQETIVALALRSAERWLDAEV